MRTKMKRPGSANSPVKCTADQHASDDNTGAVGVNTKPKLSFAPLPLDVCCRRDLPGNAKVVLARIRLHAGGGDGICYTYGPKLAKECGISKHTLVRCIAVLEAKRLLIVERGTGRPNTYRCQSGTGAKVEPMPDLRQTSSKMAPDQFQRGTATSSKVAPPIRIDVVKRGIQKRKEEMSTPPDGGNAEFFKSFSSAFKQRFEIELTYQKADFVQLANWRRSYPDITPEQFADFCRNVWDVPFGKRTWTSLRGICSDWSSAMAALKQNTGGKKTDANTNRNAKSFNDGMAKLYGNAGH